MNLYWNEIEIRPGMLLEVEEYFPSRLEGGFTRWDVVDIRKKTMEEAYYDSSSGKTHTLPAVMKRRRLQRKELLGEIVQIPACTDYLVVREYHRGEPSRVRCYSLDMLSRIREIRVL